MESINEKLKRLAKEKEAKNPNVDGVEKLPQYRGNSVIPANALCHKSKKDK